MPVTDAALDLFALCLALAPAALPGLVWQQWSFAPAIVLPLGLMLVLYFGGLRSEPASPEARRGPSLAFAAGWLFLVLALVSPMCRLAATLTSVHMAQVMTLAIVAPFLLALGRGWDLMGAGLRSDAGEDDGAARAPLPLTAIAILYGLTLWALHAPPVYAAALTDPTIHIVAVFFLLGISLAFWTAILDAAQASPGRAVAVLFATMAHTGLLGAIITFAGSLLYPIQAPGAVLWGLEPLADQQMAGLIMWVVGNVLYLAAGLWLAYGMIFRLGTEAEAKR